MITEDVINSNYVFFNKKLKEVGLDVSKLFEEKGELIRTAYYSINEDSNYIGSFLDIILKRITTTAVKINDSLPSKYQVDKNLLVKTCLLHQLGKIVMFKAFNGKASFANDLNASLKLGLRSIALCIEYNIPLSDYEIEAFTILDRTDEQSKYRTNMLAVLIRTSNDITNTILKIK